MNLLIIFLCIIGASFARPKPQNNVATITKYVFENTGLGDYHYGYETSDGQKKREIGELRNKGTDQEAMYVVGSYSYTGDDGNTYYVNYTADENGFRPVFGKGAQAVVGGYPAPTVPPRTTPRPTTAISSDVLGSLAGGGLG